MSDLNKRIICPRCPLKVCDEESLFCGLRHFQRIKEVEAKRVKRITNAQACRSWYQRNREQVLEKKAAEYQRKKMEGEAANA